MAGSQRLPPSLNPTAARVARTLLGAFPDQSFALTALAEGHLEASLPAPSGSRAGALVVFTAYEGDVWVRFAPPYACYGIDTDEELVRIVRALLSEAAVFVVVRNGDAWISTTLVHAGAEPDVDGGQQATRISWSGRWDS
jgi:hypothetical protein